MQNLIKFDIPKEKYEEYIRILITDGSLEYKKDKFVFRCPVCGDSATNKTKKRGFLLISDTGATAGCFNCELEGQGTMYFPKYLHMFFPEVHSQWTKDIMSTVSPVYKRKIVIPNKILDENVIVINYSEFIPITHKADIPLLQTAREYVIARKIPEKCWKKYYVCETGRYANRLIIPFYNRDNTYTYFNARDLTGKSGIKYMKPEHMEEIPYKANFIDYSKPFFIFEGEVDSEFVQNSTSVGGKSKIKSFLKKLEKDVRKNAIVVADGDLAGMRVSYDLFKLGCSIFNWTKDMLSYQKNGKVDINELVLNGYYSGSDLDENGQIKTEVLMKNVLKSNIPNLLLYKLEKDLLGIVLEEPTLKEKYVKPFQKKR